MSIINDALKKTQDSLNKAESSSNEEEASKNQPTTKKTLASIEQEELNKKQNAAPGNQSDKNARQKNEASLLHQSPNLLLIFIFFISLLGTIVFYLPQYPKIMTFLSKSFKSITPRSKPISDKKFQLSFPFPRANTTAAAPKTAAGKEKKNETGLHLQGIVTMDNKQFALFNDDIYEAGAEIQGKKILNVSANQVQIQDGDKIITMRTSNIK